MPIQSRKAAIAKFPLRLMPSVRRTAELFSQKEGVSLNQFINVAVAEKLAHLEHHEWTRNRNKPSEESRAKALRLLDEGGNNAPEPGDELPEGWNLHAKSSPRRPTASRAK
jgi:hypothetical protein